MTMKITTKYSPKKPATIAYRCVLLVGILLTIGRWYSVIDNSFVLFNREIHSHVSNLSLSMIVFTGIGYTWLLNGVRFRFIVVLGLLCIIANFICETLMGFMNTPDILDAVYGTVGVVISFVFLLLTSKYGLFPNTTER